MGVNKKNIYNGNVISLALEEHRLPDGRQATFEVVRHPGGAAVLPLLPDGQVVLIRQFRPSVGDMLLEIPAGRLEPGEAPEVCVRRELEEETGFRAGAVEPLGQMWTAVGFCDEVVHLFLARDLVPVQRNLDPDEFIEVVRFPLTEIMKMLAGGEIRDGKTQLALLRLACLKEEA
jgi:ADP-ribose pyrophosphatase